MHILRVWLRVGLPSLTSSLNGYPCAHAHLPPKGAHALNDHFGSDAQGEVEGTRKERRAEAEAVRALEHVPLALALGVVEPLMEYSAGVGASRIDRQLLVARPLEHFELPRLGRAAQHRAERVPVRVVEVVELGLGGGVDEVADGSHKHEGAADCRPTVRGGAAQGRGSGRAARSRRHAQERRVRAWPARAQQVGCAQALARRHSRAGIRAQAFARAYSRTVSRPRPPASMKASSTSRGQPFRTAQKKMSACEPDVSVPSMAAYGVRASHGQWFLRAHCRMCR